MKGLIVTFTIFLCQLGLIVSCGILPKKKNDNRSPSDQNHIPASFFNDYWYQKYGPMPSDVSAIFESGKIYPVLESTLESYPRDEQMAVLDALYDGVYKRSVQNSKLQLTDNQSVNMVMVENTALVAECMLYSDHTPERIPDSRANYEKARDCFLKAKNSDDEGACYSTLGPIHQTTK